MILINAHGVSKSYGGRLILSGLDWTVADGARVGLVGANGAGKSTLLRILAGRDEATTGEITRQRGLSVAYLPQDIPGDTETPLEHALAVRPELADIEADLASCEAELADAGAIADLRRIEGALERQEALLRRFDALGGPGFAGEARSHLRTLGLDDAAIDAPTATLSGGQRKLAALGACLAQRPNVLLLDEPETHLDLQRREQLEALIRDFDGAVVIVSHDRYLLDETVDEIAELDHGAVRLWPGNYSAYTLARELALQRNAELYTAQQKEIARLEEAIKRFKLWASIVANERHIKQARNKQRQIDRMEKVERPVLQRRTMGLRFRSAERSGQKAIELRDVTVAFGDEPILLGVNVEIRRGERVGVVGENGAGKSVLLKTLTGEIIPIDGQRWIGPSVTLGYYAQGQETLDLAKTPLDLVREIKPSYEHLAMAQLGRFLFTYDQARQPARALSGGERSRLQLLLLMLGGANCLALDEPTNHLDIDSAEVLEAALEQYDGTVIVVSHDRYFLDRIADRIIEVTDGDARSSLGGYSAWVEAPTAAQAEVAARAKAERDLIAAEARAQAQASARKPQVKRGK